MLLCGIDEAGRGPLAGPVCAAAVVLPDTFDTSVLNDSKKLSEKKRNHARSIIIQQASGYGIGWASVDEIDSVNILQATLLAMVRSFALLRKNMEACMFSAKDICIIVDGIHLPPIAGYKLIAESKADAHYPCVMAASILAKTARDELMYQYHKQFPQYRYDLHKGYGTVLHRNMIAIHGASPIQRKSFKTKTGKRC